MRWGPGNGLNCPCVRDLRKLPSSCYLVRIHKKSELEGGPSLDQTKQPCVKVLVSRTMRSVCCLSAPQSVVVFIAA